MPKIATTTLNLSEYRMVDGFYLRNGFSLVQDKYCTETGLPIFVNKRANGKWGYCDNDGIDFYVDWIDAEIHLALDSDEEGSTTNEENSDEEEESNDKKESFEEFYEREKDCRCNAWGCDVCQYRQRKQEEEEDSDDDEEWGQNSEFMCELVDCDTCKRPTMRKDMHWTQGGCVMTDLCEPCHKAKIPDDKMVVPRYSFHNEKGELVKWCLCVMKLDSQKL
jgi:hypothetical protein